MAKLGKRARAAREAFEGKENLTVEEAVALIKANSNVKFDETMEIAMNLGVDPRHADQMVRGVVGLPNGTGKSVRVAVFARRSRPALTFAHYAFFWPFPILLIFHIASVYSY